jgi:hypothetical protein
LYYNLEGAPKTWFKIAVLCMLRCHTCRFQPPEKFAPFLLGPGLCYNNALENAASAMEVAAVAAKNCALLVQQHVQQLAQQRQSDAALNIAVV